MYGLIPSPSSALMAHSEAPSRHHRIVLTVALIFMLATALLPLRPSAAGAEQLTFEQYVPAAYDNVNAYWQGVFTQSGYTYYAPYLLYTTATQSYNMQCTDAAGTNVVDISDGPLYCLSLIHI